MCVRGHFHYRLEGFRRNSCKAEVSICTFVAAKIVQKNHKIGMITYRLEEEEVVKSGEPETHIPNVALCA